MRLKRLEMAGFKSFVDPTKIDLDRGITAIVGPNGCGKSNIVDALRWVLGEHSAKNLRGGVMDDLIFQGSDTRSPVAVCDVELTFSVDRGALPPPYHELDEIRIRRRLMRDGGSDAFINGKMVRIKDVVDLFLDTGISTRAYAIVEQGSIARMVTAKPEDRRVIFEEAAGVMKYRSRRREAERRMKDTRQNLDRILDLLDEVRSQCRSLKQQASRAERFKKMQDEFSRTRSISFGLRYRELQTLHQKVEHQLADARNAEAEAASQLSGCEKAVSAARDQVVTHEQGAQAVQDKLRQAEGHRSDLQQQAERMAGERRLLSERKQALAARIAEMQTRRSQLLEDLQHIETQLAAQDDSALQAHQRETASAVDASLLSYRQQGEQRDHLLAEFERLRHSNEQALLQRQKAGQALNRLEERQQLLAGRLAELGEQASAQSDAAQAAARQFTDARQSQQTNMTALEAAQTTLEACRKARKQCARTLNEREAAMREWHGITQELRGRSKNQDVSDALRDGLRAKGGLWMDESLHVPEGLEAAVAAALRGRSADVRMPTDADVSDWQQALEQAGGTPVALFLGSVMDVNLVSMADTDTNTNNREQSLAVAMGLKADHPLFDVFAPIYLVDDVAHAVSSAGASGEYSGRCSVSRNGWRCEPNGWLIPPAGSRTAERLATQRQLRHAETQMQQSETTLSQAKQQFKVAEQHLEQQQKAWQQAHLLATESESACQAAEAAVARLQADVAALERHRERLQNDIEEAAGERIHWLTQAEQAADVDQSMLVEAEAKLDIQNDALRQAEQRLDQARRQLAGAEQALALFAQAREHSLRQAERLGQEETRLQIQIESDGKRLQQAEASLETARDQQDLNHRLAQAVMDVEAAHLAMNDIRSQGHVFQQAQHEAERCERQLRHLLQQATDRRQSIAVEQAQNATRLQDLAAEIMQRCQMQVGELLQQLDQQVEQQIKHTTEGMDDTGSSDAIMQRAVELEDRLNRFGPVNLLAIEEFDQASEREGFLATQASDLEASLTTLTDTIARIDRTTRQRFKEVFEQTNANFKQTFPQLFGGGRAELRLDSDDILTAGVEVIAQPPGKRLQDVTLLSGGEKALTAVALVFSIFKIKPAPFCVLDEVDAPLDDANVGRFADMVRELAGRVQFLSISHNKITMQKSDRLIGVSMPEPGVSKIVAVDLEKVEN